jgi:hypothetical protein
MVLVLLVIMGSFATTTESIKDQIYQTMLSNALSDVSRSTKVGVDDLSTMIESVTQLTQPAPQYIAPKNIQITGALNARMWYDEYVKYFVQRQSVYPDQYLMTYTAYVEYACYWLDYIPACFAFAMINESLKQGVPMNYIYAISKMETVNYNYFESLKLNANGTSDYGLMGLNSDNFDESTRHGVDFLRSYFYFDGEYTHFDHTNQRHILKVGVAYLKSLIEYTGTFEDAAIAYNGGLTKWIKKKPVKAAVSYSRNVSNFSKNVPDLIFDDSCYISLDTLLVVCREKDRIKKYVQTQFDEWEYMVITYPEPITPAIADYDMIFHSHMNPERLLVWIRKMIDFDDDEKDDDTDDNPGTFIGMVSKNRKYVILE